MQLGSSMIATARALTFSLVASLGACASVAPAPASPTSSRGGWIEAVDGADFSSNASSPRYRVTVLFDDGHRDLVELAARPPYSAGDRVVVTSNGLARE